MRTPSREPQEYSRNIIEWKDPGRYIPIVFLLFSYYIPIIFLIYSSGSLLNLRLEPWRRPAGQHLGFRVRV